jgi:hypothetical protein
MVSLIAVTNRNLEDPELRLMIAQYRDTEHKVGKGNETVDNPWCFGGKFLPRLAKNYA